MKTNTILGIICTYSGKRVLIQVYYYSRRSRLKVYSINVFIFESISYNTYYYKLLIRYCSKSTTNSLFKNQSYTISIGIMMIDNYLRFVYDKPAIMI